MKMLIDAQKIKLARYRKGMTQGEVASQTGLSRVRVCTIESGKAGTVRAENLFKLCKALDIRIDDVVSFKA